MKLRNNTAFSASLLFISAVTIGVSGAFAGPRDDALDAMARCAMIGDNGARLACYDAAVPKIRAALNAPLPPGTPTEKDKTSWFGFDFDNLFGSSPKQQVTPQQFGSERLPAPPPVPGVPPNAAEPLESIESVVTEYAYTPSGRFVLFLANGQVWRQIEGDTDKAYFKKVPGDNKIMISRGMLGSYDLKIVGGKGGYKVKRIK